MLHIADVHAGAGPHSPRPPLIPRFNGRNEGHACERSYHDCECKDYPREIGHMLLKLDVLVGVQG